MINKIKHQQPHWDQKVLAEGHSWVCSDDVIKFSQAK